MFGFMKSLPHLPAHYVHKNVSGSSQVGLGASGVTNLVRVSKRVVECDVVLRAIIN